MEKLFTGNFYQEHVYKFNAVGSNRLILNIVMFFTRYPLEIIGEY